MTESKASPRPWRTNEEWVLDANGCPVVECDSSLIGEDSLDDDKDNAALIVKAVNYYDATRTALAAEKEAWGIVAILIEQLDQMQKNYQRSNRNAWHPDSPIGQSIEAVRALAAIAKTEGE